MNGPPQRVFVFSLGRPRPGSERGQRRHYVKWRVDGRDRTRAFKTRAEADRYRSGLLLAVQDGQQFDPGTGQPVTWVEHGGAPNWWTWSREWLALKWPQWSGHTRRSAVETLTLLAPQLVPTGAPAPPEDLGDWLRKTGYRPGAPTESPPAAWLARWSLPLTDIDPATIERALQAICVKADGTPTVPSVARRRRGTLGAVLRAAVRRELQVL
ncbi:MAG: hypothetical protein Q8K58_02910 [Acidimicrobiales bacterium]|nr:hypothetical protein [Acidimicrobiales bacterium]